MVIIDYKLSASSILKLNEANLIEADLTELVAWNVYGDTIFRIDEMAFDARWGWVPLLDFAMQLYDIAYSLHTLTEQKLGFLESCEYILFKYNGNTISITASYATNRAETDIFELKRASQTFLNRLLLDLSSEWPDLLKNKVYQQIFEALQIPGKLLTRNLL